MYNAKAANQIISHISLSKKRRITVARRTKMPNNIGFLNPALAFVSLLTVTTIPYAKARAGFRNPILFGILVLLATVILRFFDNDIWEIIWFAAFALYMSYFALIPALIANGSFDE
jgi:hypothetical protein